MSLGLRKVLQFSAFLGILCLAVSFRSRLLDAIVGDLFWTALFIGSAVAVFKTWRSRDATGRPTIHYYSQLSVLPRRLQLWVCGESNPKMLASDKRP